MNFILFEYSSMWSKSWSNSFFGIWFFKFTSFESGQSVNRSLFALASAQGQPVLDLFWVRILSFDPSKADWDDIND